MFFILLLCQNQKFNVSELHPERSGGIYRPELVAENIRNLAEVLPSAMRIANGGDLKELIDAVSHLCAIAEAAYEWAASIKIFLTRFAIVKR